MRQARESFLARGSDQANPFINGHLVAKRGCFQGLYCLFCHQKKDYRILFPRGFERTGPFQ